MLTLDHLTVIAPTLNEGVEHVRNRLGLDVPFGNRHTYMGTHNHRLRLGGNVYLEIVARDPEGVDPGRARWFGVDQPDQVHRDWNQMRRLRGWVAATASIETDVARHPEFGDVVPLPFDRPEFAFSIPQDGTLPKDGLLPSLIDHRDGPTDLSEIPDFGARLVSFHLMHPKPDAIEALYQDLPIDHPPQISHGPAFRYEAVIDTPHGTRKLW
ncbi:MAG: VOC family protein [Paracoccaceae bacterium]